MVGAAIAAMVIGSVWYGPLFGKLWMKEMGYSSKDTQSDGMWKRYVVTLINSLIMMLVLSLFVVMNGQRDPSLS